MLAPGVSHNLNLGTLMDRLGTPAGVLRGEVNGFLRLADQLIALLGNDQSLSHQNVLRARVVGVEASIGWSSPGDHLALDGNITWQDLRNQSDEGVFGEFVGDRLPHRPWLLATGSARLRLNNLATAGDELVLTWVARYVHAFFRSWESAGRRDTKQVVPSQLTHTAGVSYRVQGRVLAITSTIEMHNLTNARTFDFFGAQRPGRGVFAKMVVEY